MIPAERCIGGRDLTEVRLSPDASTVSFVARHGSTVSIVLVPAGGGPERHLTAQPPPRPGRGLGGGCYDWLPDGSGVVYVGADGNLWLQHLSATAARRLTDVGDDAACSGPAVSPDGTRVVVAVDLERIIAVSLDDATTERRDDGTHDFVMDPCWSPDGATVVWQAWSPPAMPWDHSVMVVHDRSTGGQSVLGEDRPAQAQQPRFDVDGRLWILEDTHGWLNLTCEGSVALPEPFEHGGPAWGPGQRSFAVSPDGRRVAFARNEAGFGRLCVLDHASGTVTELARGVHGSLHWVGHLLVALRTGARTPTQVVVYEPDGGAERITLAVGPLVGWEQAALAEPELVTCPASDGAPLHGRLYRAEEQRGLLCWIHGGPTDQWPVTFLPRFAHWMAQGYSILVPDHRGSTGHGREYQQALRERWGDLDVTDTADLLRHAQAQGWGAPQQTAVMGSSAGGFTALGLVAREPDLVGAAAVLYPVTDLADLAERSHRFERHYTDTLVGDPKRHPDRYQKRSPLYQAERLAAVPLLVLHGTDDPVVPVEQSRSLVEAVRTAGGTVDYHEYEGEGHGFRQPVNQLDEYARVAAFLTFHLGGSDPHSH